MTTGKELSVSQTVPMRPEDRQRLRLAAAENAVGPGLLARALILAGLEAIGDERIQEKVRSEYEAEQARQSAAGQAAMRARWHGESASEGGAR